MVDKNKSTKNNSFLEYSISALIYSLMIKNRSDLFHKLAFLYDDETWHYEQLWVKVYTDDIINAEEMIKLLKSQEINKRYINNELKLYIEQMETLLFRKFNQTYSNPNDLIDKKPAGVSEAVLFANISFPENVRIRHDVPTLDTRKFYPPRGQ